MRQPFAPPHRPAGASPAGVPSAARRGSESATTLVGARIRSHATAARAKSPKRIARPGGPIGGAGRPASKRDGGAENVPMSPIFTQRGVSTPAAPRRDPLKHLLQEYLVALCVTLSCDAELVRTPVWPSRRDCGSRGAPRVGFGPCAPSAFGWGAGLPDVRCPDVLLHEGGGSRGLLCGMLPAVDARGGGAVAPIDRLTRVRGARGDRAGCARSPSHRVSPWAGAPRRPARPLRPSLSPFRGPPGLISRRAFLAPSERTVP